MDSPDGHLSHQREKDHFTTWFLTAFGLHREATNVHISRTTISMTYLQKVLSLPKLRGLSLSRVSLIQDTEEEMSRATQVEKLEIESVAWTGSSLSHFLKLIALQKHLQVIKISQMPLASAPLERILTLLSLHTDLSVVDLDACGLDQVHWTGLRLGSLCWRNVTELHLPRNRLTERHIWEISTAFPSRNSLETIDLSENYLSDTGVDEVCRWIHRARLQLVKLGLSSNNIGAEGAVLLADMLTQQTVLALLYLGSNPMTDIGTLKILSSVHHLPLQYLDLSDTGCTCLTLFQALELNVVQLVNLKDNNLTPPALIHVKFQSKSPSLQSLILPRTFFGNPGLRVLAEKRTDFAKLKILNLAQCGIMIEGAEALAGLLSCTPILKKLILQDNCLNGAGVTQLKPVLETLRHLKELDLKGNNLGPQGAATLSTVFPSLQKLTFLRLSENHIGNEGLDSLNVGLMHLHRLEALLLADNDLDSAAFPRFLSVLSSLKAMKSLNLNKNRISNSGISDLIPVLRKLRNLTTLSISATLISDEVVPELCSVLSDLPFFSHFHCDSNKLNPTFLSLLGKSRFLVNVSARKNEFHTRNQTLNYPLVREMDVSYSDLNRFEGVSGYMETGNFSGCDFPNSTWKGLFSHCGDQLRTLYLDDDHLTAESLSTLFQHARFLTHLSLSNVLLDSLNCCWEMVGKSLEVLDISHINTQSQESVIRQVIMSLPNLRRLSFTQNALNLQDQGEVLLALGTLEFLEELEVGNVRGRQGLGMGDALQHLHTLRSVRFKGFRYVDKRVAICLRRLRLLRSVEIMGFTDSGFMSEFWRTLSIGPKLHVLELSGSILSKEKLTNLWVGISAQTDLTVLRFANCRMDRDSLNSLFTVLISSSVLLQELDVSGNDLRFGDTDLFSQLLLTQQNLHLLCISGVRIDEESVPSFGVSLASHPELRTLQMDGSVISPWAGLIQTLVKSRNLTHFSFSNSNITNDIMVESVPLFQNMSFLKTICVEFNKITGTSLAILADLCLSKHCGIKLRGNPIATEDLDEVIGNVERVEDGWFLGEYLMIR